jgi:hypothetical protein
MQLVEWYSLVADPTEDTVPLLMWVAWYHMFHCSGTICLAPDRMATQLPTAPKLLCDITMDVMGSSVVHAIIVTLISCVLCLNLVMALYMLQHCKTQECTATQMIVGGIMLQHSLIGLMQDMIFVAYCFHSWKYLTTPHISLKFRRFVTNHI